MFLPSNLYGVSNLNVFHPFTILGSEDAVIVCSVRFSPSREVRTHTVRDSMFRREASAARIPVSSLPIKVLTVPAGM